MALTRADRAVLAFSLLVVFPLAGVALRAHVRQAERVDCAQALRRLGLAAVQYSDDKRFFPHVRALTQLDGDRDSADSPKTMRALLWYGYLDDPGAFVCPASEDRAGAGVSPGGSLRDWTWRGYEAHAGAHPFLSGPEADPTLRETDQLSYGWTRRTGG